MRGRALADLGDVDGARAAVQEGARAFFEDEGVWEQVAFGGVWDGG